MKRLRASLAGLLAPGAWLFAPAAAHACAVCGAVNDPNRAAFFWTTVLLSLLPLGLLGGGLLFLRRAGRHWLADEFAERDAPAEPAARLAAEAAPSLPPASARRP